MAMEGTVIYVVREKEPMRKKIALILCILVAAVLFACSASAKEVTGTVADATNMTVTIKTDAGEQMEFSKEGADESGLADGISIDQKVTITYTEPKDGEQLSQATKITDAK